jgi:hypothetical protein
MPDNLVVFECPVCGLAITNPLIGLTPGQFICAECRKPAVPLGCFGIDRSEPSSGLGSVLVNLADLVGTKHHPDFHRLNGCCGLDGCDGPNLICPNGHEIGTENSDCWMPHAAILLETIVWHRSD